MARKRMNWISPQPKEEIIVNVPEDSLKESETEANPKDSNLVMLCEVTDQLDTSAGLLVPCTRFVLKEINDNKAVIKAYGKELVLPANKIIIIH